MARDFPQLVFHSPNKRNISELVFVETLSADKLIDRLPHPSGTETAESTEVTSKLASAIVLIFCWLSILSHHGTKKKDHTTERGSGCQGGECPG